MSEERGFDDILKDMEALEGNGDWATAHYRADMLLLELIELMTYKPAPNTAIILLIIAAWESVGKWYS